MCTAFLCQKIQLNVVVLTSSSRNLVLGIGTYFSCQILGLNVVVQSSSSRTIVSDTKTQSSNTDI